MNSQRPFVDLMCVVVKVWILLACNRYSRDIYWMNNWIVDSRDLLVMLITCENIPGQNIIDAISGVGLACTKYLVELVLFYVNFYKANIIELFIPLRELYIFFVCSMLLPFVLPTTLFHPLSTTYSHPSESLVCTLIFSTVTSLGLLVSARVCRHWVHVEEWYTIWFFQSLAHSLNIKSSVVIPFNQRDWSFYINPLCGVCCISLV